MDDVIIRSQCQKALDNDEGQLHPTLDAIICPHCGAVNLFEPIAIIPGSPTRNRCWMRRGKDIITRTTISFPIWSNQ